MHPALERIAKKLAGLERQQKECCSECDNPLASLDFFEMMKYTQVIAVLRNNDRLREAPHTHTHRAMGPAPGPGLSRQARPSPWRTRLGGAYRRKKSMESKNHGMDPSGDVQQQRCAFCAHEWSHELALARAWMFRELGAA